MLRAPSSLPYSTHRQAQGLAQRLAITCLLSVCLGVAAEVLPSDGELLAAARVASIAYQNHIQTLTAALSASTISASTISASTISASTQKTRSEALRTLGELHDPQAVLSILTFLEQPEHSREDLLAAALALGTAGEPSAISALHKLTVNGNEDVRLAAYNALGSLNRASAADHAQRAKDSDEIPHLAALTNLGTLKQADAAPLLIAGLERHPRAVVRRMCAIGLGKIGDKANGPMLQNALSDPDPGVRRYAAEAIASLGYRPAIPFLLFALEANIAGNDLSKVITHMTGQNFGFDSSADTLRRTAAIERGFAWWTAHSADGG
jgi:HEAT repeat protein